jgi:hypothetical protein
MTVSLILSAALASLGAFFTGFLPAPEIILHGIDFLISMAIIGVLFAAMYRFLSQHKNRMARRLYRRRRDLPFLQYRKNRARALYRKIRNSLIVWGGRIDTRAASSDRYGSRPKPKPVRRRSVTVTKTLMAARLKG